MATLTRGAKNFPVKWIIATLIAIVIAGGIGYAFSSFSSPTPGSESKADAPSNSQLVIPAWAQPSAPASQQQTAPSLSQVEKDRIFRQVRLNQSAMLSTDYRADDYNGGDAEALHALNVIDFGENYLRGGPGYTAATAVPREAWLRWGRSWNPNANRSLRAITPQYSGTSEFLPGSTTTVTFQYETLSHMPNVNDNHGTVTLTFFYDGEELNVRDIIY